MLCIVGAGNMGQALVAGFVDSGTEDIALVERNVERQSALVARFPSVSVVSEPVPCDGAIIAVKPRDVEPAVSNAVTAGAERIISVATAITLTQLGEAAQHVVPVARSMPNIAAFIASSATAVCSLDVEMLAWTTSVMRSVGTVVSVDEARFDAAIAVAGSGLAYIFFVVEAMMDAGHEAGLSKEEARMLSVATLQGAGGLLGQNRETARGLRERVSTKGGTTVEGLRVLEERSIKVAFRDAIAAAARRSRELTQQHSR